MVYKCRAGSSLLSFVETHSNKKLCWNAL